MIADPQPSLDDAERRLQQGDAPGAEALLRALLGAAPDHAEAHNLLGNALQAQRRSDEAEGCYLRALALRPGFYKPIANLGNLLAQRGLREEAIARYGEALSLSPGAFRTRTNLGHELFEVGRFEEAAAAYTTALQGKPDHPPARLGLGRALLALDRAAEALAQIDGALAALPGRADLHHARGLCLERLGRLDDAAAAHRSSLALEAQRAHVHKDLAIVLSALGLLDDAAGHAARAGELDPRLVDAHLTLGMIRVRQGRLDEGIACYREAIAQRPGLPEAYSNLGAALQLQGKVPEAIAHLRRALELRPDHAVVRSNLLMALHYDLAAGPRALAEEHRAWGRRHGGAATPEMPAILPRPRARLRVGYVSADLRDHSVARFVEPIFASFDREAFDVVAYAGAARADAVTERLRSLVTEWRDVRGLSDADLAQRIRGDGIDILVDLGGHSADGRLGVFARRPAPVQVTYLGYPDTTGLAAMDYRLTDALADPPGEADARCVEELVRLPESAWCYAPGDAAEVSPPPFEAAGHVTFGAFNDFSKVRPDVMALWAEILREVPGARLLMKAKSLGDPALAREVRAFFARRGIDEARVEARGWTRDRAQHLALHAAVDVGLDTSPYHGTTTTCDALWMGVPVITLAGDAHVSRVGVSLLTGVGLPDLVARSPEAYVALAVRLAGDRARLEELRRTLRGRVRGARLGGARAFTRALEDAYRAMWRARCDGPAAPRADDAAIPDEAEILPTGEGARLVLPRSRELITPCVLYEQGDWFEDEIRFVRRVVEPGATALDVGANYGVYTIALGRAVGPGGQVLAFEPAPATARLLAASVRASELGCVRVLEAAVSSRDGEATFYASRHAELSSLREVEGAWETKQTVKLVALDGMRAAWSGRRVTFVKLDAEGEEAAIVEGARATLAEHEPLVMYEIKHGATMELSLVATLARLGMRSYRLVPGLGILVPFDPAGELDPFLLNVFACTSKRASELERRGLLSTARTANAPAEAADPAAWRAFLAARPYAHVFAGLPGAAGPLGQALAPYAWAHAAATAPPAHRVAALERARALCREQVSSGGVAARMTLARACAELGERGRAASLLAELEPTIAAGELPSQPFVPVTASFEGISPRAELARWCLASVLAARERLQRFSCVYGSHDPASLSRFVELGFRDEEMLRRLEIVTQRNLAR